MQPGSEKDQDRRERRGRSERDGDVVDFASVEFLPCWEEFPFVGDVSDVLCFVLVMELFVATGR